MPNLAVGVNYSYTRTTDLFGNFTGTITPRVGVTLADYTPGSGFSGTLPLDGGVAYNVPTYIPNAAEIAAGGNGFLTTNVPGFYTDYHGIELSAEQAAVEPVDGPRRRRVQQRARALRPGRRDVRHQRQPDADGHRAARRRRAVRAAERRQRRRHDLHQREVAVQRQRDVSGAVRHRAERQRVRPAGLSLPALPHGTQRRSAPTRR